MRHSGLRFFQHTAILLEAGNGIGSPDPAALIIAILPQLKVGDAITAVISQALLVSVEPAPKSWF
jgi:hypothetical protein